MANLFGTGINQVPTNGMLGSLAFQDKAYVAVDAIGIGTTFVDSGTASQPLQVAGGGYFSGNVGIGTTNPSAKLDVYGTSRFGGTTAAGRRVDITTDGIVTLAYGNNANASNLILQNAGDTGATTNHGNSILWQFGTSTTTVPIDAGEVKIAKELQWTTTATTQDAYFSISLALNGTVGEKLRVTSSGNLGIGTTNPSSQLHITGQFQSTQANSATTGGGQIYLNGANGNRIDFSTAGVAAPAFTTRSAGTKLVLYPSVGGSTVDYAFGIEDATLWSSVPNSTNQFKWYAGTTNIATLKGTGELGIGTTNPTATLTVAGNSANILIGKQYATANTITLNGSTATADYNILSTSANNLFINRPSGKTITFAQADLSHANFDTSNNFILNSGNLAIGNFTPNYAIDAGAASLNKAGRVGSIIFGTAGTSYGVVGYNAKPSALNAWTYDVTDVASWIQFLSGGHVFYRAASGTAANSITALESGRFDSSGNLLLGTSTSTGTASQPLQVNGGAYVSGNVGIGTTNPAALLHLSSGANTTLRLTDTAGSYSDIIYNESGSVSTLILDADPTNSSVPGTAIIMKTDGSERLRVDALGRLLVGTSTARVFDSASATLTPLTQIESTGAESAFSIVRNNAASTGPGLFFGKSRSGANGGTTVVQIEDRLGTIFFEGTDGTNLIEAASIFAQVDGTPGTNDMPGRLVFATTADGASSPTEQMRVTSAGNVGIGTTNPSTKLHVTGATTSNGDFYAGDDGSVRIGTGNTPVTYNNLAFGKNALLNFSAGMGLSGGNLAFGTNSQRNDTSGNDNVSIGYGSLYVNNGGICNVAIGSNALASAVSCYNNVAIGQSALGGAASTGSIYDNVAIGFGAGNGISNNSNNNIFIGSGIAQYDAGGISGSNNVAIGRNVVNLNGSGQLAVGNSSGAWIYGDSSYNVGLGTTYPTRKLHVSGDARITGAIYDSGDLAGTSGQVLTSTGTGTQWASSGGGVDAIEVMLFG